uniref:Eukaryotic translation initiation factor 4 gamma 2 n=1 Tax=Ornithodoros moubata TaxID=6938 RepID=A0A1Z5L6M0_ORNMO
MYASLCRELCRESPNFDPPESNTFRRLLLTKCQDEFENRRKANEAFEHREGSLTQEEQEQRLLAKHKMLGNIKFIGELGKQGLLQESILHQCIQQLLVASARRSGGRSTPSEVEWQDLECLCQIMVTVGRRLDTQRARSLMEQYFERMRTLASAADLPPRIRFLLQDVVELRQNGWVPRRGNSEHGPRTIQQIREEASRDLGVYLSSRVSNNKASSLGGMDDVFAPLPMGKLGTGPGVIPSDNFFPYTNNRNAGRPSSLGNSGFLGGFYNGRGTNRAGGRGEQLPPRFLKKQGPASVDEISLRPAQNSMVLKPKTAFTKTPQSPITAPHPLAKQALKEPPIVVKQVVQDKNRANKADALTKEEVVKRVEGLLSNFKGDNTNVDEVAAAFQALRIPKKFLHEALGNLMLGTLHKLESDWDTVTHVALALKKDNALGSAYLDALQEVFGRMSTLEEEGGVARVKSLVAGQVARGVAQGLVSLSELAHLLPNGAHYPIFLLVLQQLSKSQGAQWLQTALRAAKVDLEATALPPEGLRSQEKLAEVLDDRGLGFLLPRLQGDLWRQLRADPSPGGLYRWLRESLEPEQQSDPAFASALMTCLLRHIVSEAESAPDKGEKEQELAQRYQSLLRAFLAERPPLQLAAVYALQVFWHQRGFPKGSLLRWFMLLYDLEVVDEESFLRWREDVNDDYPGKGKALFQVNQWLTWLEEAEEEEECSDEGDN